MLDAAAEDEVLVVDSDSDLSSEPMQVCVPYAGMCPLCRYVSPMQVCVPYVLPQAKGQA